MMNIGIAEPEPGYLQGLEGPPAPARRAAHLRRGEVRCRDRAPAARSSATACNPTSRASPRRSPAARPARRSAAARDVMEAIERGAAQQGTFNGNPLVAAAGLAALTEVLDPRRVRAPREARHPHGRAAAARRIDEHGIPGHAVDLGAKGCVSYRPEPLAQLPRLPRGQRRDLRRVVPVDGQPRRVHDAGRRGAVDALGAAHRSRRRPLRRRVRRSVRGAGEGVKRTPPDDLDDADKAIVELLQETGACRTPGIASRGRPLRGGGAQRVQRLIDGNVVQIVGVTDPLRLGFRRQAMVGVKTEGDIETVADTLAGDPRGRLRRVRRRAPTTCSSRSCARTTSTCCRSSTTRSGASPASARPRPTRTCACTSRRTPGDAMTVEAPAGPAEPRRPQERVGRRCSPSASRGR